METIDCTYEGFKHGKLDVLQADDDNHNASFDPDNYVVITKRHFAALAESSEWLKCLEAAGVDNWQGIDMAYEIKCDLDG